MSSPLSSFHLKTIFFLCNKSFPDEFEKAEKILHKLIKKEFFVAIEDTDISPLRYWKDNGGVIRAKPKIVQREDSENFRYPIISPSDYPGVQILIYETHLENQHAGVSLLMDPIRFY
ncbi:hypothetical protein NPIL_622001 [Nephila pilipes]|uniref:Uncharacterized protein n=1 Tax=Nephila pilipes TaxID=299642 RepID=A0A8X6QZX0_NEPPI|nr:hypothetical protein NPIL_622001 [Nephila pilipes]